MHKKEWPRAWNAGGQFFEGVKEESDLCLLNSILSYFDVKVMVNLSFKDSRKFCIKFLRSTWFSIIPLERADMA